jgi:hypothetical protein
MLREWFLARWTASSGSDVRICPVGDSGRKREPRLKLMTPSFGSPARRSRSPQTVPAG